MSHKNSSRSGSSGLMKDILRGALDVLTEPSSSRSNSHSRSPPEYSRSSSSRRDYDHGYHAPRRTATQPEPRRHRDSDEYTGIPSHTYSQRDDSRASSGSSSKELKEMLGKAAIELSRVVGSFEEKLRDRKNGDRVDAGPGQFRNDDERFEVLSDSDPETYNNSRSQSFHNQHSQGRQRSTDRGLADEYYLPEYHSSPAPAANAPYSSGQSYPPHSSTPNNAYMNYHHPQPVDPTLPDYHSPADARPKPKRSSTSTSQTMKKVGNEILHNLPQLLERAGWLLKILDLQQKRSGGRSITGYSGLLMALNLVVELYRQFGSERKLKSEGRSRDRRH